MFQILTWMTALISRVGGYDDDVDGDDGDEAEWYDDECEIEAGIWGFSEAGDHYITMVMTMRRCW